MILMNQRDFARMLLVWVAFAIPVAGWAQGSAAATATPAKTTEAKATEYSFEGDTIEGDLSKPDAEYIEARKAIQHANLIRIRDSFKEKILQSVGEL